MEISCNNDRLNCLIHRMQGTTVWRATNLQHTCKIEKVACETWTLPGTIAAGVETEPSRCALNPMYDNRDLTNMVRLAHEKRPYPPCKTMAVCAWVS